MLKNMKKKIMLAVVAMLALGNIMSVSAATMANSATYAGYVTRTTEYVTDSLYKTVLGDGTNKVSYVEDSRDLCSWITNYIGMQVTDSVNYSGPGTKYMNFDVVPDVEHPGGHLSTQMVVSTRWYELFSANTSGTWGPDPF